MSGIVRIIILLLTGLALGIGYNAWAPHSSVALTTSRGQDAVSLEVLSYGIGLFVGMVLWQIGSVPWSALPAHLHQYLASKMQFYQFVMMGGACLAVLFYL